MGTTGEDTQFTISKKGPYIILRAQYDTSYPQADPYDYLIIKGPYELNALIQFLSQELKRDYPNWEGFAKVQKDNLL